MFRAPMAAIGVAAVLTPALLASSGCSAFSDIKKGVDEGVNTVEVCNASIDLYNAQMKKVEAATTTLTSAKPADAATALTTFYATLKTELGTLHTGLAEQAKKAKAAKVKAALETLDSEVAAVAADPKSIAEDNGAVGQKLETAEKALNTACHAEEPKK